MDDLLTIVVTGAGGAAGVAVVRDLKGRGHSVVAADASADAVGMRLADQRALLPLGDEAGFADAVVELAARTRPAAVVCTVAEEMVALGRATARLAAAGVATWLPDPATVSTCIDKWRFATAAAAAGAPVPATAVGGGGGVPGPWIVKPRFGRGSRHVVAVDDVAALDCALRSVPDPIVQSRLEGREFTVDALVDRDGTLAGAVPRWRLETKGGISVKGLTFADDALVGAVGGLLAALGLVGPANVQGFMADDGRFAFTEVNPRFSGGLPLSIAAGADLVGEYLRAVLGSPVRPERLAHRPGVLMLRSFEEFFEG